MVSKIQQRWMFTGWYVFVRIAYDGYFTLQGLFVRASWLCFDLLKASALHVLICYCCPCVLRVAPCIYMIIVCTGSGMGNFERHQWRQARADQVSGAARVHRAPLGLARGARREDHHRGAGRPREHSQGASLLFSSPFGNIPGAGQVMIASLGFSLFEVYMEVVM